MDPATPLTTDETIEAAGGGEPPDGGGGEDSWRRGRLFFLLLIKFSSSFFCFIFWFTFPTSSSRSRIYICCNAASFVATGRMLAVVITGRPLVAAAADRPLAVVYALVAGRLVAVRPLVVCTARLLPSDIHKLHIPAAAHLHHHFIST